MFRKAPVTVRFNTPPGDATISDLEEHGLTFKRDNGSLLHTKHIYLAIVDLDSLESLSRHESFVLMESIYNPSRTSTLDVSNPLVQASTVWNYTYNSSPIDGTGVIIANVDTGIDIYHPAFFKANGGVYDWIDTDGSGSFDSGIDAVDMNKNGSVDSDETLAFYDAPFSDLYGIMNNQPGMYEADTDWLYNDRNANGIRDYGPVKGFTENSLTYGEMLFIISDTNRNNRLDPGERLTALGTSKVLAAFDKNGKHLRGIDLLESSGDLSNHGTPAFGILCGQHPGRKFAGVAPGIECVSINRNEVDDYLEGVLWARQLGAKLIMYEFGSWVYEYLDGSSNLETFIKDLYEEGLHQFTASGNLAGPTRKKHAYLEMEQDEKDTLYFTVPESYSISEVYFSILWRNKMLYGPVVTVNLSDTESARLFGDGTTYTVGSFSVMSGLSQSEKGTSRLDCLISSKTPFHGDMAIQLDNFRRISLKLDAYISDNVTKWVNGAQFLNHLTDDGTVCTPATTEKDITVGAFDPRGYRNTIGELSDFSSWGETIDGRRALDITAPGFTVFSPSSHTNTTLNPGGYVDFGGTSASLPFVAGCAALLVQINPNIFPDELSRILLDYAQSDDFTGLVPNTKWGFGKVKIYNSLTKAEFITSAETDNKPLQFSVSNPFPNPFNSTTTFIVTNTTDQIEPLTVTFYTILGQKIKVMRNISLASGKHLIQWNGEDDRGVKAASGIYLIKFSIKNYSCYRRILFCK